MLTDGLKKPPTLLLQDDDLSVTPETALLFLFASRIISPTVSKMGIFNYKKISFLGYKELGGLHPNRFNPDYNVIKKFNPNKKILFNKIGFTKSYSRCW